MKIIAHRLSGVSCNRHAINLGSMNHGNRLNEYEDSDVSDANNVILRLSQVEYSNLRLNLGE